MQAKAKTSALRRLKRIEGQVRGLARMVEMDRYCIDVVTQISAVRAALRAVEEEILADHVANCVEHAISSGNKAEERRKVAELMDVLSRASRWRTGSHFPARCCSGDAAFDSANAYYGPKQRSDSRGRE